MAVTDPAITLEFELVGFVLVALHVQLGVEVTFPDKVGDQRPRWHQLLDLGQRYGLRLAIHHPHHTLASGFQVLAALPGKTRALDQQRLVGAQGIDILPVDQHPTGILGFQRQLAAVQQHDLPRQAVAIVQPDGIGPGRQRQTQQ